MNEEVWAKIRREMLVELARLDGPFIYAQAHQAACGGRGRPALPSALRQLLLELVREGILRRVKGPKGVTYEWIGEEA